MSHKGIRLLIEHTAKSLADNITFDYGRRSDTNMNRDIQYPLIACNPLSATASYTVNNVSNYIKVWQVQIAFLQLDKEESDQEEYSKHLDEMNKLADMFINKLNFNAQGDCVESGDIVITGVSQQPFVKIMKDTVTGYVMNFSIQETDDFNYCEVVC